jgi:hypothetical protein
VVTGDIDIGGAFYGAIIKLIAPIKAVVGYYGSDANSFNGYFVKEGSLGHDGAGPDRQEGCGQYARRAPRVRAA